MKIKVAIAEDHDLVRQGFVMLLNKHHPDLEIIFESSNGRELLKQLKNGKPDIILLDIQMPGIGGIKLIETIKTRYPKIKIIVISAHQEITSIVEYVIKGAHSFLPKNCDIKELILTINKVQEYGIFFNENLAKELAKNGVMIQGLNKEKKLTDRDIIFIKCLEEKLTDSEIANRMDIKNGEGIYRYKRRLFLKTNSTSLTELISYAKKNKLI